MPVSVARPVCLAALWAGDRLFECLAVLGTEARVIGGRERCHEPQGDESRMLLQRKRVAR